MPFTLVTIPCRSDNYAFLLHNDDTGQTLLADAPEAAPIIAELDDRGWTLDDLLITHHHQDHIDGVEALRDKYGCRVVGARADRHRLPPLDLEVDPDTEFETCGTVASVIDVSGHTVGHIAFHIPQAEAAFTGDSLMALGCGRLFEGTAPQMWESLLRLRALPPQTRICSGHEYTAANARFALTVDGDNSDLVDRAARIDAARAEGKATVPSLLSEECATNPFLRADATGMDAQVDLPGAEAATVFAEIRSRKDNF
ncbi:hydroxyacylglutathione hydrolase [Ponticoccus sp. SC2-23]|uniref:hydroxyacylglutathione hydrolase n=1 Tax=Alexandriicola marinus TaxID=2081710 RepID=UPI000FD99A92|nr:hydroxyacylglutathione hydrolase [Alexandriicola marinus]MBM1220087.1 hydroxyacylglutathione hydrolase [Ponticoccus sp. SC6-9]MBM1224773.1 hydroxyacylglutathione hydrolase [Ponticoccus sp. SC6-15]MBM1228286.1 hydroxyacylglutathione hydrolase [Ponticoccus sp. SC6-38]MBM1234076.1 hydroxyacylglutathione hydrolase [Ponticoccus sp. SC6-45]MBM1238788.1 hydroxyacylglutathione hydrolase [Ponticoccus sp. SC6-49]MBM1242569.1 hydroxyacylglutathione hydrolase [Ponticoccus sp. SC2-64]MBM1247600.1 hydr